jgi:hypothetical protein
VDDDDDNDDNDNDNNEDHDDNNDAEKKGDNDNLGARQWLDSFVPIQLKEIKKVNENFAFIWVWSDTK